MKNLEKICPTDGLVFPSEVTYCSKCGSLLPEPTEYWMLIREVFGRQFRNQPATFKGWGPASVPKSTLSALIESLNIEAEYGATLPTGVVLVSNPVKVEMSSGSFATWQELNGWQEAGEGERGQIIWKPKLEINQGPVSNLQMASPEDY